MAIISMRTVRTVGAWTQDKHIGLEQGRECLVENYEFISKSSELL